MSKRQPDAECPLCYVGMRPPKSAEGYQDWRDCPACGMSRQLETLKDLKLRQNARMHHLHQLLAALAAGERARHILAALKSQGLVKNPEIKAVMSTRLEAEFSNASSTADPLEHNAQSAVLRALDMRRKR